MEFPISSVYRIECQFGWIIHVTARIGSSTNYLFVSHQPLVAGRPEAPRVIIDDVRYQDVACNERSKTGDQLDAHAIKGRPAAAPAWYQY